MTQDVIRHGLYINRCDVVAAREPGVCARATIERYRRPWTRANMLPDLQGLVLRLPPCGM